MTQQSAPSILIVDDDPLFCRRLQLSLQRDDCRAHAVHSGVEAISWIGDNAVDLILLDYFLPDMTGEQFVRSLREAGKTTPFVLITGAGDERLAVHMIRRGATDYVPKDTAIFEVITSVVTRALWQEQQRRKLVEAEQRLQLARAILETLNQPSQGFEAIRGILRLIKDHTGFDVVGIRLRDQIEPLMVRIIGVGQAEFESESLPCSLRRDDLTDDAETAWDCLCGRVIRGTVDTQERCFTGAGSFWSNQFSALPGFCPVEGHTQGDCPLCLHAQFESVALVPLRSGSDIVGLLQLSDARRDQLNLDLVRFFEGMGNSIGLALERQRIEEERQWETGVNGTLAVLARVMISAHSIEEISRHVLQHAMELTGSPAGYVGYVDPDTQRLVLAACGNPTGHAADCGETPRVFEHFTGDWGMVLTRRRPIMQNQVNPNAFAAPAPLQDVTVERFLSAPALFGEQVVGQIALANAPAAYRSRDLLFLRRLADFYAIAVQRHWSEKALAENEATLRRMFDESPTGAALIGPDHRFIRVNPELCRISGYSAGELVGSDWRSLVQMDGDGAGGQAEDLLAGRIDHYQTDSRVCRKDGRPVWVRQSVRLVRDGAGRPLFFLPVFEDITERKQSEEQLSRERAKLFAVLDGLPSFVYMQGRDYRVRFANKRFRELFGDYDDRQCYELLEGRCEPCPKCLPFSVFDSRKPVVWDWTDAQGRSYIIHDSLFTGDEGEDLLLEVGVEVTELKRAQAALRRAHDELELRVAQRTAELSDTVDVLQMEVKARAFAEQALRESEAKFRHIYDNSPVMMHSIDEKGLIVSANPCWLEEMGYEEQEVIGRPLSVLMTSDSFRRAQELILPRFWDRGFVRDVEYEFVRKDGTVINVLLNCEATTDPGGRRISLSVVRNITEQKRVEAAVKAYQERLRSLTLELALAEDRERRELAADLHDSVGQTLVFAQIKVESLRDSAEGSALGPALDEIDQLVEQTIRDLHTLIFEISPPVLHELGFVAAVEWLAEQMQQKHGIPCRLQVGTNSDIPLDGDGRVVVFRMVRELLVNAVRHSQADKIDVVVDLDDGLLSVAVEDDGVGFEPALVNQSMPNHRGFGLFNIRERLHQLGGQLVLESQPQAGTRAMIEIPMNGFGKGQEDKQ